MGKIETYVASIDISDKFFWSISGSGQGQFFITTSVIPKTTARQVRAFLVGKSEEEVFLT